MSQGKEDPGHNTAVNGRFRGRGQKRAGVYASSEQEDHMDVASDDDISDEPPPKRILDSYKRRRQSVCAERYDPDADDEDDKKVVHPKSDGQRTRLAQAVGNILLFKSLDPEQMQEVLDAMFERKVTPDEHVIDQGDDGDNFYVIDSGTYNIFVKIDGTDKHVGSYDNTGSFGELALMYNTPRAATIVATSDGSLWALDRQTFRRILLKNAYKKRKMFENLLDNVPMLKTLEQYERMKVADALMTQIFEDGEVIIRQGDSADCMYFVEDGVVRIAMKNKNADDPDKELEVTRCKQGDYFGELALVTNNPRAASAYAVGKTKVARLDVHAFERLLGPCKELMKRNIELYEEQIHEIFGSKLQLQETQ
ncbi:cAMP-dependent protein kinase type II-alpha regulatory subunit-like isoform X3 [Branchiostoma floridae]|uniref:cAMP-dependent protein kinase type II regulatory subunit n=1 Tax=Branchiostoma floridae TaxID=7739 RepID=A0A9J7MQA2_BRAFL|nr:cAMP-dependent protein kinase type II-alpha regulatory subunit-like isoform X3 [Branchiostoma floridae]XP_035675652.1 cAMP-dependent protein kinase type II-alpha regulatory subunit-like isoform X3 [Branchiostoma floridae]